MDVSKQDPLTNARAMEQTKALADTLSKDADPKFQNSKFLQFVSKMSRGEIILEDNQVRPYCYDHSAAVGCESSNEVVSSTTTTSQSDSSTTKSKFVLMPSPQG